MRGWRGRRWDGADVVASTLLWEAEGEALKAVSLSVCGVSFSFIGRHDDSGSARTARVWPLLKRAVLYDFRP